jgi:hypothetical protein
MADLRHRAEYRAEKALLLQAVGKRGSNGRDAHRP